MLNKKIGTAQSTSNDRTGDIPPTKIIITDKIFKTKYNRKIGSYILNPECYKLEYTPEKLFGTNNFSEITSEEITEILANPSNTTLRVKPNILYYLGLDNTHSILISNNTLFIIISKNGIQSFYSYKKES